MPTSKQIVDRRGRKARHPGEIPTKGWRDIAYRIKDSLDDDNISIVAAGVAFYALLAIFPALVAMVSIYGIIADPADVQRQFDALSGILPTEAQVLLSEQLRRITSQASTALSVGVGVGVILALWSATRGTKAFIIALNIVYGEKEKRGFLKLNAIALMLTLGAIVLAILALGMIVVLPILLSYLDLPEIFQVLASLLPWLLLAFTFILGLAVLYRYGPSRSEARWRWVSWGAVAATVLWIVGSALFSFYVANFAQYNKTYGSVGALIILLMWFFVTAYIILLAAEFNAEMEHQTKVDTTRGKPQPMGERGAYVADTVGKPYGDETGAP
ncbi:Ribonuclease BN [Nitrosococcus oceani ATCC 19707]|uniref:Ribonuclease BN n=2 Tax=Nitrosococcus oceani TaxID=1229 RepID=Q3JC68_NITOC|nr:YihY/virulence factor BrkB family protein [Nitrosococcus oceani]ABA57578.1 Ribonuclease BN [Nitrosococcus oceani ATCC 19707]EDZ68453.1 YihY family protein [Nitrosococcus oceani AFC27]KFI20081.1 membrane protein [Nitrosococcus oceani C-27]GEM20629.1 ribonuclease [Nitrosococcus oceani]